MWTSIAFVVLVWIFVPPHLFSQSLSHFLEKNDISYCESDSITTKQLGWSHIFWEMCMHVDHMAVPHNNFYTNCVTRAPLLYFIRSWVALSFKVVSEWVSQSGIGNTCPDLHFLQCIKAWMSSTDPVSSITNCYRLIVSYTDPVHSFIIS